MGSNSIGQNTQSLQAAVSAHGSPSPDKRPSLCGLRIALIDDETGVLRALSMVLQAFDGEVFSFSRALDALPAIETHPVDIVVSDLRMPGLSGVEFLTTLRSKGDRTPFILMSGHATAADVAEADALGVNGYVPKPFSPPQLVSEILRVATNAGLALPMKSASS